MAVSTPCYANRDEVKASLDFKESARNNAQVDRAIEAASRAVDQMLNRRFYPIDATRKYDWPNFQGAYPWRLWLDQNELAAAATAVTSGGTSIPISNIIFQPYNDGPPYTNIEIDRSTSSSFGHGNTPQNEVVITGSFGYSLTTAPAGALAVAMNDTTTGSATMTDSSKIGVGDVMIVGTERMLVMDRGMTTTSQTQQSTGVSTASMSDKSLLVTDGTKYFVGETLLLDSERMLIVDISSNTLTVTRAWDGTTLATHSGATIYAPRLLTITRGDFGTTAATHLISTTAVKNAPPGPIKALCIAEAMNYVLQETAGYARTIGDGATVRNISGGGINDLRKRVSQAYGRRARQRVV